MATITTRTGENVSASSRGNSQKSPRLQSDSQFSHDVSQLKPSFSNVKLKREELILFTTQLSVMLDSGVLLSDALDAIAESVSGPKSLVFSTMIMGISESVKGGENLSKAMTRYPKVFSPMFISMVKASEASGKTVEMLRVLSGYLGFEAETNKQIKSALTYPIIMAVMAVTATATLMFFVLPRFMKIYDAKGAALPKLTQMLVSISRIASDASSLTITITVLMLSIFGFYCWVGTPGGKRVIDWMKIRCPILGTMFIDILITRSMRIMTTMISTGVSLLDTIEVIRDSCENSYFRELWSVTDEKIRDGYQLSESISIADGLSSVSNSQLIAPGVIQMLRAGEKGGKLGPVTDKISIFYEKKLKASIKTVMTFIEPLMITILGGIIGTIAIALLLPVFKISKVIAS